MGATSSPMRRTPGAPGPRQQRGQQFERRRSYAAAGEARHVDGSTCRDDGAVHGLHQPLENGWRRVTPNVEMRAGIVRRHMFAMQQEIEALN